MNYIVLDIETECKKVYKRVANPWFNEIVAWSYKTRHNQVTEYSQDLHMFFEELYNNKLLIAHNVKFECLYLWKFLAFQDWLKAGGTVWDTQAVEYLLTGQQHKYPALRDIAVNKYKCSERIKYLDKSLFDKKKTLNNLWEELESSKNSERIYELQDEINEIESYNKVKDLPKELILYDVKNDVLDTEKVFLQQLIEVENNKMCSLVNNEMNAILATTEMEYNGMYCNKDILRQTCDKLVTSINSKIENLDKLIVNIWPKSTKFNVQSGPHISMLLFGGELIVKEQEPTIDEDGNFIVYKSGIREGEVKLKNVERTIKIDGLKINKRHSAITKKKGIYKTDEETLSNILDQGPTAYLCTFNRKILELVLEIRNLSKQISTYFNGWGELVYELDSCIHGSFNHTAIDTGRLSSSKPNQQNAPKHNVSDFRKAFITRYIE